MVSRYCRVEFNVSERFRQDLGLQCQTSIRLRIVVISTWALFEPNLFKTKIFGPKKICSKEFGAKKLLSPIKIAGRKKESKKVVFKNILGSKNFWYKNLRSKYILSKNVGPKK